MLVATREILLENLLVLPSLVDAYQRNDNGFVNRANSWLQDLEKTLNQLRSPLTSLVAAERSRIIAALNGFRDPVLGEGKISTRRAVNVIASLALRNTEAALAARIHEIDQKTEVWREKLAQFISVASIPVPIPLPPTEPRHLWLKKIWTDWQTVQEAKAMYNYLNTAMSSADRLNLLGELLTNHLNGNGNGN